MGPGDETRSDDNLPARDARVLFTKAFDRRVWISLVVLVLSGLAGASLTLYAAWPSRVRLGYAPLQPIAYSHQLHAGVMEIDCRYCHTGAETTPHANVPALAVCMNCHAVFKPDAKKQEQVAKIAVLLRYVETNTPVAWNRVYDLSDFVYFRHDRHLAAGVDCRNCHGDVGTMEVVEQVAPLTMGWCLKCHMAREGVQVTDEPAFARKKGIEIVKDPVYGPIMAPIHCSTCHR